VLAVQGKFAEAREHYLSSLAIKKQLGGDTRGEGVVLIQLGTLALRERDLAEAVKSYREAMELCQRLGEPLLESIAHHQLGMVLREAKKWDEAETHLRRAADICVSQGWMVGQNGAAATWIELANLNMRAGRPEAAETWYRKIIEVTRQAGDKVNLSIHFPISPTCSRRSRNASPKPTSLPKKPWP
jgi:tetratricopeptide (TPR) repeat protein